MGVPPFVPARVDLYFMRNRTFNSVVGAAQTGVAMICRRCICMCVSKNWVAAYHADFSELLHKRDVKRDSSACALLFGWGKLKTGRGKKMTTYYRTCRAKRSPGWLLAETEDEELFSVCKNVSCFGIRQLFLSVLSVCLVVCMSCCLYVLSVCLVCTSCLYVLSLCLVCMPCLSVLSVCLVSLPAYLVCPHP